MRKWLRGRRGGMLRKDGVTEIVGPSDDRMNDALFGMIVSATTRKGEDLGGDAEKEVKSRACAREIRFCRTIGDFGEDRQNYSSEGIFRSTRQRAGHMRVRIGVRFVDERRGLCKSRNTQNRSRNRTRQRRRGKGDWGYKGLIFIHGNRRI